MEDCRGKATITKQQHFERSDGKTVLVSVPSRWQIKEDPQRVSHLQRELNPESAIAVVKATYEVVFSASKNMDEHAHEFCGKFKFSISSSDFKQRHPSLSRRQGSRLGNDVSTVASLLSGDFSSSLSKTGSISRSKSSLISMDSKGPSRQTSDISIRSENSQSHCSTSTHRPVIKQPLHPQRQQQARYEHASSSERLAQGRRHWPKPIRPMQFRSDSFQSHLNESSRLGDTHKTQLSPIGDCYRDNELGGEFGSVSSNYSKPNSWPRLPHGQAPHLPPTGDPEVDRYARRLHINKQPVKPPPPPGMEGSESYYDSSNNLEWSTPTTSSGWNDSTKMETWNPQAHENTMLESPSSNDLSSVGGLRMPDHGSTGHLSSNSFHRRTSSWNEHWN
ncbi:Oidioi.mRNA.OKI2018_I69.PAR.g11103.t1.cds [Oikopleura dioica]|uniref:Oidioi.mRNA.OKI2018_I69.PAR.g11103.t1.cds n=1 Tax=Oikopleura dioica TaxID=34765 RepID=A0ABN7RXB7_OIKDI|nr:Oidioi.mRNA.OKI2018_I69.PAR.g11103.t1.cds [Oikopleura dioica]